MGFPGGASGKELACNMGDAGDLGLIPGSGIFPGRWHGNPIQYSSLENPMDRGTWWALVHRVAKVGHDRSDRAHTHTQASFSMKIFCFSAQFVENNFLSPLSCVSTSVENDKVCQKIFFLRLTTEMIIWLLSFILLYSKLCLLFLKNHIIEARLTCKKLYVFNSMSLRISTYHWNHYHHQSHRYIHCHLVSFHLQHYYYFYLCVVRTLNIWFILSIF